MSFNDYLDCRGISFVVKVFSDYQFDVVGMHLRELGIDRFEFFQEVWKRMRNGATALSQIYEALIAETTDELFESSEAAVAYYADDANYDRLVRGEIGDNVMRKYLTRIWIAHCREAFELCYDVLSNLLRDAGKDASCSESLDAAKRWLIETRNLGAIFAMETHVMNPRTLVLSHNVPAWYAARGQEGSLASFADPCAFTIQSDICRIQKLIRSATDMFETDMGYWVPKALENTQVQDFWCSTDPV